MSAWVVISVYGNDLEFIGVFFFPLFLESVDVIYGCGKGVVIWIEIVGDDLGYVVSVCTMECSLSGLLVGEGV